MKTLCLFPLELRRLFQSRLTWLIVGLTVLSPAVGLILYKPATASTMLSMYLANPAIAGGVVGGILFGLLSVFESDRAARSRVDVPDGCGSFPSDDGISTPFGSVGRVGGDRGRYDAGLAPHQCGADRFGLWRCGLYLSLSVPYGIVLAAVDSGCGIRLSVHTAVDLSVVLFAAFAALSPDGVGRQLAVVLVEPLRVGPIG